MEKIRVNGMVHYATEVLPAGGHMLLCEEPKSPDPRNPRKIGSMVRGDRVDDATEVDCMACCVADPTWLTGSGSSSP